MSNNIHFIEAQLHTVMLACLNIAKPVTDYGLPIEPTQGQIGKMPAIYVGWGSMKPQETTTETGYAFTMPVTLCLSQSKASLLSPICFHMHEALLPLPEYMAGVHLSVWKLIDRQLVNMIDRDMVKAVLRYRAVVYINN